MTEFEQHFDRLTEAAREQFERDGSHDHLIYLLSFPLGERGLQEVPFGAIVHTMPGGDIHSKKERAYRSVASMMVQRGLPGYIEIMEVWITSSKSSSQEETLRRYNEILNRYGSIEAMPGRDEMLVIHGRHGQETKTQNWRIGRRGEEVWLEHGLDGFTWGGGVAKSAVLDRTSLKLAGS